MPTDDVTPPQHADPTEVAKKLLEHYLGPTLRKLSDRARHELVDAWRANPAAVIAAASVLGAAGATYLIESKSALPGLPAIPLDFVGGVFAGAELQLKVGGPITQPNALQFTVTFHERAPAKPAPGGNEGPAPIDAALSRAGTSPETIAKAIDGPWFETETPGGGPEDNWSADLGERVRLIGSMLLERASRGIDRPFIDLGDMPFVPETFAQGLRKMVEALVAALPDDLGDVVQVNFAVRNAVDGWIPVIVKS